MHPYRDPERRSLRERAEDAVVLRLGAAAKLFVVGWVLVRGAVAAYDGRSSPDLWLGAAVLLVVAWTRP